MRAFNVLAGDMPSQTPHTVLPKANEIHFLRLIKLLAPNLLPFCCFGFYFQILRFDCVFRLFFLFGVGISTSWGKLETDGGSKCQRKRWGFVSVPRAGNEFSIAKCFLIIYMECNSWTEEHRQSSGVQGFFVALLLSNASCPFTLGSSGETASLA